MYVLICKDHMFDLFMYVCVHIYVRCTCMCMYNVCIYAVDYEVSIRIFQLFFKKK